MIQDLDLHRERLLELGANKTAHLDGDLLAHFGNVSRNLQEMSRPDYVVLAGLYHGSYGTHALHGEDTFELDAAQRERISAYIGEPAERLVYLFSVMTYESLGRSVRNMLKPGGKPALWNRCSDEALPATEEEFHDVLWIKLADILAHLPHFTREERREAMTTYGPFWRFVAEYLGADKTPGWPAVSERAMLDAEL